MPASPSYRHVLLVVAATACWGCGTVLSKHVLERGVAPLTLLAVELAASSLLLLLAMLLLRVRLTRSPAMVKLAVLGILNPGVAYALGLLGLASITASMSVLLWATEPILIMLLAVFVLRERIALSTTAAVTVALAGALIVIYRPGASGDATGIALTVAAVSACAFYAVLTRRLLLDDSSPNRGSSATGRSPLFRHSGCLDRIGHRSSRTRPAPPPGDVGTCGSIRDGLLRLRVLVLRGRPQRATGLGRREFPSLDPGLWACRRLHGG